MHRISANMPASDHELPADSADFACARCWKQKKKCDKAAPRCGRCTTQAAVCVYSTHPPKESVFTVKPLENSTQVTQPDEEWFAAYQKTCVPLNPLNPNHHVSNTNQSSVNHESTPNVRFTTRSQVGSDNWDEEFASQVHGIFTASGQDIESVCRTYFENFHPWLSFISEPDFWRGFSSAGSHPEFSTLLLSMYVITHVPAQESNHMDTLDPVYFTAKSAWSRLQKVQEPSIVLIQAGLLIATYESGQALTEKSRSTMVACAELGYKMRLQKSLRRKADCDLCGQNELKARRRLWWGIVTLERLLAAKDFDEGYNFATPHPALDDYLPSNHDSSFADIPSPQVLGIAVKDTSEPAEISFPGVDAFPAVVQTCYLLGRVMNHIKSNTLPLERQEKESTFLDRTIQTFASSLLRQAEGSTLQGHYCTPFFLSLIALVILHQHELKQSSISYETFSVSAPPRPILALQVLARMFRDMTGSLRLSESEALQVPCFQIYTLYLSLCLHIRVGDRSDEVDWADGLRKSLMYLRIVRRKWRLAEVYVNEIVALQNGDLRNEYSL